MNTVGTLCAGLVMALAVTAHAETGPRLVGGGDDAQVVYLDAAPGNVVGGGRTLIATGFGGPFPIHLDPMPANAADFATMSGGGDDMVLNHAPAAVATNLLASRR